MSEEIRDLFVRRMEIVQEIARLNARQLRDRQQFGGCEFELATCERSEDCDAETLRSAREQVEAMAARLAANAEELDAWNARLDEVDRRISGSGLP